MAYAIYNADNWQKFNDLDISLNGRHLYNYILTGRQKNLIGLCIFSIPVASIDTKLSTRSITKALKELSMHNLIAFDPKSCSLFARETLLDLLKKGELKPEDNRVKAVFKIWQTIKGLTNQVVTSFFELYGQPLLLNTPSEAPLPSFQGSKYAGKKILEDLDPEILNLKKEIEQTLVSEIVDPYTTVYQLKQFGQQHFKNDRTTEHQLSSWLEEHGSVSLELLRKAALKTKQKIADGNKIDGPMLYTLACAINGISSGTSKSSKGKAGNRELTQEEIHQRAEARYQRGQQEAIEREKKFQLSKEENDRLGKEMFRLLRESKIA